MSASMRVLQTGIMSARANIAFAAAMSELHRAGQVPDTVRFYSYPRAVLLGRRQVVAKAVHQRACKREGVEIARRPHDGDALYVNSRVLAWDVVAERRSFGGVPGAALESISQGIAAGLARFGLPVRLAQSRSIVIGGRKVAMAEGSLDGATVAVQGIVLVGMNVAEAESVLRIPTASRSPPGPATLASPTASLAEWLGRVPDMDEVRALLIAGLSHSWSRQLHPGRPSAMELELTDRLLACGTGPDDDGPAFAGSVSTAPLRAAGRSAVRGAART